MTIGWTVDDRAVDAAPVGSQPLTRLEVSGSGQDDLWAQFVARDRQWRRGGYAFRIDRPAGPGTANVTARAVWRTVDGRECDVRTSFRLHWLAPEAMTPFPDPVPLPDPLRRDELDHREDERRRHVVDDSVFVVTPVRYVWSVASTQRCCGRQVPHRVVQFTRAVIDSDEAHLRRLRPWGLDVTQSQKDDARRGERFDPGLTQRPGRTDTQLDTHPGGEPAVSHWDGPGLSEVRYRQLLLTPGRHTFAQQFLSLLVCAGTRTGTADALLDDYRVEKAVLFTITWTFDGPVDESGRVDVRVSVDDRRPVGCKSLREVLQANGLMQAFRQPEPAELKRTDLPRTELQRQLDFAGIVVPP